MNFNFLLFLVDIRHIKKEIIAKYTIRRTITADPQS